MIEVVQLTKQYSSGKGIFDVSFKVKKGEVFGFLGPNGAGKTTTIRHLLGFTNANQGYARIMDLDTRKDDAKIKAHLGYIPGEIAFFDGMTGYEFLNFISDLRHQKHAPLRQHLIERFELESDRPIRKMSKGMKQKVALIAAFMHDPSILILDEPTSGLDPLMQRRFIELIQEEKTKGKTILMSSHQFEEVEKTCEKVAIIKDGRIVEIQAIQDLKQQVKRRYTIGFNDEHSLLKFLKRGFDVKPVNHLSVELTLDQDINKLISALQGLDVAHLDMMSQSLEQIFIHYYGDQEVKS
jgi:ABC-2 type transport system ATP-binding protein